MLDYATIINDKANIDHLMYQARRQAAELSAMFEQGYAIPLSKTLSIPYRIKRERTRKEWVDAVVTFRSLLKTNEIVDDAMSHYTSYSPGPKYKGTAMRKEFAKRAVVATLPNASDGLLEALGKGFAFSSGWELKLLQVLKTLGPFEDVERLFIMTWAEVPLGDIIELSKLPLSYLYRMSPSPKKD